MRLLPRGEKAEAYAAADGSCLESSKLPLRHRILVGIEVQKPPRLDEREPGRELREDRFELRLDGGDVSHRTRAIAQRVALPANGPVSTDNTGDEMVLAHANVDQLAAKYSHSFLAIPIKLDRPNPRSQTHGLQNTVLLPPT